MSEMKQYEVLKWASSFLKTHQCEEGIAEILLLHHLGVNRSTFFMNMQEIIPQTVVDKVKRDIYSHVETGVPVQHLTGYEYFYGRKFTVNEHTLIPRPETEELVLHIIKEVEALKLLNPVIVDIGTGSGVIAITLAKEIPNAIVYATDISAKALKIAQGNSGRLQAKVVFYEGDFLHPILDRKIRPHIIVSNPPYIAETDRTTLSRTVKEFDPSLALFAKDDGLRAYKEITMATTQLPDPPKLIAYEIGYQQGEAVSEILRRCYPGGHIQVIQDINDKDRIVSVKQSHVKNISL